MLSKFQNFIKLENILNTNEKVLLGVSGGMDSMVMVDLFSKAGFNFGIAHCNFGLRGKESDEDSSFVKSLAAKYKVSFYLEEFDTLTHAKTHSSSIQMTARELRINWFEELISKQNYDYYATAHHLDDQIETILNNFFRGTGISGLHGILPKRGHLIHPMLFCYRNQIEDYAIQNNLDYRTDSSNKKTDYTRNQIRHQLIPVIKSIYPTYQKTISDNTQRIQKIESIYKNHIQQIADELTEENKEYNKISINNLLQLQPVETYLYELIKQFGFNYTNATDIIDSIDSDSGKYFLSDSHKITKDRTDLIIEKRILTDQQELVFEKDENIRLDSGSLDCKFQKATSEFIISKNPNVAHLDSDKIIFPIKLRKWQQGDFFYPLGMNQKKLLSDFFIDNKISIPDKEKTWILLSEDQIVWIVGLRIDNRYKIRKSTKDIMRIEYRAI